MMHNEIDGKDPIQVAMIIDDFCNQYGLTREAKKMAEVLTTDKTHRQLQTYIFDTFMVCIKAWADRKQGYDARNRWTHERCVEIVRALGEYVAYKSSGKRKSVIPEKVTQKVEDYLKDINYAINHRAENPSQKRKLKVKKAEVEKILSWLQTANREGV